MIDKNKFTEGIKRIMGDGSDEYDDLMTINKMIKEFRSIERLIPPKYSIGQDIYTGYDESVFKHSLLIMFDKEISLDSSILLFSIVYFTYTRFKSSFFSSKNFIIMFHYFFFVNL